MGKWQCSVNWKHTHLERCAAFPPSRKFSEKFLTADCTKVSTSLFHFYYTRLRSKKNWNIITFLLVMVVWIHNFFEIFFSDRTRRATVDYDFWVFLFHSFVLSIAHFYGTRLFNIKQKEHNSITEKCQRAGERVMDVLNYLMKIMIM